MDLTKYTSTVLLGIVMSGQTATAATTFSGEPLVDGIISTVIYSILGVLMALVSFKAIDLLTPGKLSKDIADNNIALALLTGLMMLGICIIIAAVLAS